MESQDIRPLMSFHYIGTRPVSGQTGKSERIYEATWAADADPLAVDMKLRGMALEDTLR